MEWTKAKCRADRWEEEIILLDEEMRRVLEYGDWKADWWIQQGREGRRVDSSIAQEGMDAYAAQQANQEHRMAESFASKWVLVRENARFIIDRALGNTTGSLPARVHDANELISINVDVDDDDEDLEATMSDFEE